jgi:hypothetical protein
VTVSKRPLLLFLTSFSFLPACGDEARRTSGPVVRDSAGIRIVENHEPTWTEGQAWRLSEEPVSDIGGLEGDPNYELFRVWSAVRLQNGRIVIANSGTTELRFFDANGAYLAASGGEGGGPGEFGSLSWVQAFGTDSLVAYDVMRGRLLIHDSDGRFVRTITTEPLQGGWFARVQGAFADGTWLARRDGDFGPDTPKGIIRPEVELFRYSANGQTAESVGTFLGTELYIQPLPSGGITMLTPLFGRSSEFAVYGHRFYVAVNDTYEIKIYETDGKLETIIRRDAPPLEVTSEDAELFDRHRDRIDRIRSPDLRRLIRRAYEEMAVPATMPAFGSATRARIPWLRIDNLNHLWLPEYNRPGETVPQWTVFDPAGVLLGTLRFPERFEPLQIGDDFVLGKWQDELDVEHVQLYELVKP